MSSFNIAFLLGVHMALHVLGLSIYIYICSKVGTQMHAQTNFRNVFNYPRITYFNNFWKEIWRTSVWKAHPATHTFCAGLWLIPNRYIYHPQTKFAKVMFSQVSVCPQGGSVPLHAGIHTHTQEQTPLRSRHPVGRHPPPSRHPHHPLGADYPWLYIYRHHLGRHPLADTPYTVHAGRYGKQAGGTHPTGMYTFNKLSWNFKNRLQDLNARTETQGDGNRTSTTVLKRSWVMDN